MAYICKVDKNNISEDKLAAHDGNNGLCRYKVLASSFSSRSWFSARIPYADKGNKHI